MRKFKKAIALIPADATYGNNPAATVMKIAELVLDSQAAEKQNNPAEAESLLKQAISIQDQLFYNEPSDWFYAIRETLGSLLLRQQKFKEAEEVFREDLRRQPRNGRALFGLLLSLNGQGRPADAYWVEQDLKKAWQYSDTQLNLSDL